MTSACKNLHKTRLVFGSDTWLCLTRAQKRNAWPRATETDRICEETNSLSSYLSESGLFFLLSLCNQPRGDRQGSSSAWWPSLAAEELGQLMEHGNPPCQLKEAEWGIFGSLQQAFRRQSLSLTWLGSLMPKGPLRYRHTLCLGRNQRPSRVAQVTAMCCDWPCSR